MLTSSVFQAFVHYMQLEVINEVVSNTSSADEGAIFSNNSSDGFDGLLTRAKYVFSNDRAVMVLGPPSLSFELDFFGVSSLSLTWVGTYRFSTSVSFDR